MRSMAQRIAHRPANNLAEEIAGTLKCGVQRCKLEIDYLLASG